MSFNFRSMKNQLRKWLSRERRDLWDSPREYLIGHLPVDKLKHMENHIANNDIKMRSKLKEALRWRKRMGYSRNVTNCYRCGKKRECRHLVLTDYSEDGGWVEDGMYCRECENAIAEFMNP